MAMRSVHVALGSLLLAFLTSGCLFGDDPKTTPEARGSLPQHWSKLGLTEEQKQKAYTLEKEYDAKIDALERQIKTVQEQKRDELAKVLTDEQKALLQKILTSKARWLVLFRSDDPSMWDTESRRGEDIAVPLSWAPATVPHLRQHPM